MLPSIPRFGQMPHHSSVPTRDRQAAACSVGPGRPPGRRARALPWTDANPVADWARLGAVILLLGLIPVPSVAGDDPVGEAVREASGRFGIPASWITALIRVESAGDARALSPKGAMGLMQVMPGTYADLRHRHGLGPDPWDIRDNILAGTAYLRALQDRYGSDGGYAAYNAGPARYAEHLVTGKPLPVETRAYLARLALTGDGPSPAVASDWRQALLFAGRWSGQ